MTYLKYWFPVLVYSGIIFFLSSIPAEALHVPFTMWDKLEHCIEYSAYAFIVAWAFDHTRKFPTKLLWLAVVVFCTTYGLTDEYHQSFVPGRESSLLDALADCIGGMLGAVFYIILKGKVIKNGSH